MKAITVTPGIPNSAQLREVPEPILDEIPGGRGVLVRILRVGLDGTDREINAGEYGKVPEGYDFLVIGHENFGRVEAMGPNVTEFQPGDYVVATVRRRGSSIYDLIGTYDMTTDDEYYERGINLRHGFLTEYYVDDVEFIVKVPQAGQEPNHNEIDHQQDHRVPDRHKGSRVMASCRDISSNPSQDAQHRHHQAEAFADEPGGQTNRQQIKHGKLHLESGEVIDCADRPQHRQTRRHQ